MTTVKVSTARSRTNYELGIQIATENRWQFPFTTSCSWDQEDVQVIRVNRLLFSDCNCKQIAIIFFNSILKIYCNFLALVHVAGIQWMFMFSVTWDEMNIYIIDMMIYIELEVIIE